MTQDTQGMTSWQPLAGIKVADFSVLLPGPLSTVLLADLGADVVKVEPPGGDAARTLLPDMFRSVNRNKRSVVLDLKATEGREHAAKIAAWADVFIESSRPGVADRLGIGFDQLTAANPRLIYCSLSGYGQDGPWKDRPGHDLNYLAASGALAFPGTWGARPARSSVPIADIVAGSLACSAILAALRERDHTGKAVRLDLSLFESALFCTALRHGLDENADPAGHLFPGNDFFETADGRLISLGLLEDRFWHAFVKLTEARAPELGNPEFATLAGRREHGDELTELLRVVLKQCSAQKWDGLLEGSDVPFDICVTPAEAVRSSHIKARGRVAACNNEQFVPFPVTVNDHERPPVKSTAPSLGQHTDDFLGGLSAAPAKP